MSPDIGNDVQDRIVKIPAILRVHIEALVEFYGVDGYREDDINIEFDSGRERVFLLSKQEETDAAASMRKNDVST